jgi:hypothetical protein
MTLKDGGDDERIILKWVLVKWDVMLWRFIWLGVGFSGGQNNACKGTLVPKMAENFFTI